MPLKIDISDVTVEKHESMHELHLWGVHTALWKNNCIVCGKDTNADKIHCGCGDGFYCSPYCQGHPAAHPEKQCLFLNCAPLKTRPTPNHRRAVVFQSEEPNLCLVWAKIEGNHVIIDHPTLDECYRGANGTDKPWVDLAVVNPVTDGSELFRKIGHGIAIGEFHGPVCFTAHWLTMRQASPRPRWSPGPARWTPAGATRASWTLLLRATGACGRARSSFSVMDTT
jgi:hypothetical protein